MKPLTLILLLVCAVLPISVFAGSFETDVMTRAMNYAKAGSCSLDILDGWNCKSACDDPSVAHFQLSQVQDFPPLRSFTGVDHVNHQLVLAFRGAVNMENWVSSLDFAQVNCMYGEGCKMHGGFLETYDVLRLQVRAEVVRLSQMYPTYTWLITGLSLGGAMVYVAAADLTCYLPTVATASSPLSNVVVGAGSSGQCGTISAQLYTFGSPRVGNAAFSQWFTQHMIGDSFRVLQSKDPVPHLPPRAFGFVHVPNEVWFYDDEDPSKYKLCSDSGRKEDRTCSNSVLPLNPLNHMTISGKCLICFCTLKESFQLPLPLLIKLTWAYMQDFFNL